MQVGITVELSVAVNRGQFNVALTGWDSFEFNGRALWLGVRARDAGGVYRDLGRRQILAVPYAMSLMPGARIYAAGATPGLYVRSVNDDGIQVYTNHIGSDFAAVWAEAQGNAGTVKGGYFRSYKGIGLYGRSDTLEGVYGESANHDGVTGRSVVAGRSGVYGKSVNGYGVTGESEQTHGVLGRTLTTTGTAHGVYGTTASASGVGVYGANSTTGAGVAGFMSGYTAADIAGDYWMPGGLFGGRNGVIGVSKADGGYAVMGWNKATTGSTSYGIFARTDSSAGYAGRFNTSVGNGVSISTPTGKVGLIVSGGSKSAVVATDDGARLLYTEESTEVWFTDYGFGQLISGQAVITIDPLFAQTVNLTEPYHVFLQAYGDATLYVTNRTATGFEVHSREADATVEFSYRLVALRLGYENTRLERAPWADNDVNLYPERAGMDPTRQLELPVDAPTP